MIYKSRLVGAMVEAGYSSIAAAGKAIGIPAATMYRKVKTEGFTMPEIDAMIETYGIRHPEEIFVFGKR